MGGGKALRHQVFMYMDCKCVYIIVMFYKSCKVVPSFFPLWKQTKHTYLFVS